MKLHASSTQQYQTVTGYDENGVEINAQPYNYSLIVMPEAPPRAWASCLGAAAPGWWRGR